MYFFHASEIWNKFRSLRALVMVVQGVEQAKRNAVDLSDTLDEVICRLDGTKESEFSSIQAWRQTYSSMGLKPTQYRCAAEAMLRRFRKDRSMPRFHTLVDVLNAESMRAAIPIAAFDLAYVVDGIEVRPATSDEVYTTFRGEIGDPEKGEIIFADAAKQAHSRRWVYRQGAVSVVRDSSNTVLIVAEAMHDNAETELAVLESRLRAWADKLGIFVVKASLVTPESPHFEFASP